jgi:K+-sensing histidine kinase KdpD
MKAPININRLEAYLIASVIFLVFFALRLATLRITNGDPYIAFLPAAMLATLRLGVGPGLFAGALGALAGLYYIAPPPFSFRIYKPADLGDLSVYALLCLISCALIHFLNRRSASSVDSR